MTPRGSFFTEKIQNKQRSKQANPTDAQIAMKKYKNYEKMRQYNSSES
jgi:hypothetical protein